MYLKKLEMKGFKSFADRTEVDFMSGVTCVVGPNGSGKSNITDAMRWVLGEQKVKTLRGSKMEDVIFNGTGVRKSVNFAEVSLTFDNTESYFPIDYTEVIITRRVHRNGDSEYLLNNMPCRLKDVKELFMDTGIGTDGYSIIGQGKIDDILSNNKDDRRQIFEEAAGIVKYKARKNEAARKLSRTNDNLIRISDIVTERETRIIPLQKDAEKAENYIELSTELKSIDVNMMIRRYEQIESQLETLNTEIHGFDEKLEAIGAEQLKIKEHYNKESQTLHALREMMKHLEEQRLDLSGTINISEGEKNLLLEKVNNINDHLTRVEGEILDIEKDRKRYDDEMDLFANEKKGLVSEKQAIEANIESFEEGIQKLLDELKGIESDKESHRATVIAKLNDIEVKKNEIINLNRSIEDLNGRVAKLDEAALLHKDTILEVAESLAESDEQVKAIVDDERDLNDQVATYIKNGDEMKRSIEELRKQYEILLSDISEIEGQYKLLVEMEKNFEGYERSVKNTLTLLERRTELKEGYHDLVANIIDVPSKFEKSIEVALGKAMQNLVVETVDDARMIIDALKKDRLGRVTFLPLDNIREKGDQGKEFKEAQGIVGFIGKANDVIGFDSRYDVLFDHLLGRIIIVENFEAAKAMIRIKNLKYKVVTLDGEVLNPGGTITGGSFRNNTASLFGRKRQIQELKEKLDLSKANRSEIQKDIIAKEEASKLASGKLSELYAILDELKIDRVNCERNIEMYKSQITSANQMIHQLDGDKETLNHQVLRLTEDVRLHQDQIVESQSLIESLEAEIVSSGEHAGGTEAAIKEKQDAMMEERMKVASVTEKLESLARDLNRLEEVFQGYESKIGEKVSELDAYKKEKSDYNIQIDALTEKIQAVKLEFATCEETLVHHTEKSETMDVDLKGILEKINTLGAEMDAFKESNHKDQVKKAKLDMEKDKIIEELWDRYELSVLQAFDYKQDVVVKDTKARIKQLKSAIKVLGPVNIGAIEEFKELKESYDFLKAQENDLIEARDSLNKVIADLEKRMKKQFIEHFVVVKEHFKGTFEKLFEGGVADLIIVDKDDCLNSDIEIVAQPPGKKLQSISLLSGGEKALTAISLLFAILKTKPAPFCILDEIEAALDDVNVFRFADFLKEFIEDSQFIVITHRKGTMEIADILYGVTMEEYGVSKIVSVKLEDIAI